jgi:hypothetical protein
VAKEILRGPALGDDLEAGVLEEARNPLAEQDGVVGEHYAQTAKPLPRCAERWEASGQAGDVELKEPHRFVEAGQLVLAQIRDFVR